MFFRKKTPARTFNDVLTTLGAQKFDVSPARDASIAGAYRVSKYGCAAEIAAAPPPAKGVVAAPAEVTARAGWLLNGSIAKLEDRGYQKFLVSPKLQIAATADILRAIHQFSEELKEAIGAMSLYNQSLGTTSDTYRYDRVKGRAGSFDPDHRTADPLQRSTAVEKSSSDDANAL